MKISRKVRRRLKIMFGLGIPLGLILIFIQKTLHISDDIFFKYYIIFSVVIIIGAVIFNLVWNLRFQKKVIAISKDMLDGKNVDENIVLLEEKLNKCYSECNKAIILINLSVAYSDKGDYAKALQFIKSINPKKLPAITKTIYYINLAYYSFVLGDLDFGAKVSEDNRKMFDKFKDIETLKFPIMINNAYTMFAKGDIEKAKECLILAENVCKDDRNKRELDLAYKNIVENKDN